MSITSALTFNVFSRSEMLKISGGLRPLVPASDSVLQPLTVHLAFVVTMALTSIQRQNSSVRVKRNDLCIAHVPLQVLPQLRVAEPLDHSI